MTRDGVSGTGWDEIIKRLYHKMIMLDPNFELFQIKEKFGGLRFYYTSSSEHKAVLEAMDRYIVEAYKESLITCEYCGSFGSSNKIKGWIKTLCGDCVVKYEK